MKDFIKTELPITILINQVEKALNLRLNVFRAKRGHHVDEAVEGDSVRLPINLLPNILEQLLNHHSVFKLQLRKPIIHQSPQVNASPIDLNVREILKVSGRTFLSSFIYFF